MWQEPRCTRECSHRTWWVVFQMLGASIAGLAGTVGVMISMPLLMVTPPEQAAEFLDRLEGWIDDHEARVEELNAELDRLDAWRDRQPQPQRERGLI